MPTGSASTSGTQNDDVQMTDTESETLENFMRNVLALNEESSPASFPASQEMETDRRVLKRKRSPEPKDSRKSLRGMGYSPAARDGMYVFALRAVV